MSFFELGEATVNEMLEENDVFEGPIVVPRLPVVCFEPLWRELREAAMQYAGSEARGLGASWTVDQIWHYILVADMVETLSECNILVRFLLGITSLNLANLKKAFGDPFMDLDIRVALRVRSELFLPSQAAVLLGVGY
ncbi:hypothetical protein BDZ97DRAFT_1752406 [Flammula alnicola]|nr:hypothetical protein BDZ97DRAFT_1752406 [Flammula alnicola]